MEILHEWRNGSMGMQSTVRSLRPKCRIKHSPLLCWALKRLRSSRPVFAGNNRKIYKVSPTASERSRHLQGRVVGERRCVMGSVQTGRCIGLRALSARKYQQRQMTINVQYLHFCLSLRYSMFLVPCSIFLFDPHPFVGQSIKSTRSTITALLWTVDCFARQSQAKEGGPWTFSAYPFSSTEKSNDVSRNFVLNFPDRKVGLSIKAR
jgi:hypothetical protein